jgi:hypothetical protein
MVVVPPDLVFQDAEQLHTADPLFETENAGFGPGLGGNVAGVAIGGELVEGGAETGVGAGGAAGDAGAVVGLRVGRLQLPELAQPEGEHGFRAGRAARVGEDGGAADALGPQRVRQKLREMQPVFGAVVRPRRHGTIRSGEVSMVRQAAVALLDALQVVVEERRGDALARAEPGPRALRSQLCQELLAVRARSG